MLIFTTLQIYISKSKNITCLIFKNRHNYSALQEKQRGTQRDFVSSGFQLRHLWLTVESDHTIFTLAMGDKSISSLKAPSIYY